MVQYVRDGVLYATEDHWVFRSDDRGLEWETVCRLECRNNSALGEIKDRILRMETVRRVRRNIGITNLVVLKSGTILIQYDGIYRYDGKGGDAERVFGFEDENIIGPLKNGFVTDDTSGNVYFGEYSIERPHAVRIIRGTDDGRRWEVCHRFAEGRIRHVHAIVPDSYRKRLWICTGDNDSESGLFYTEDDFQTVSLFAGGDQSWRMVSLIPTKDALYWGSDAGQDAPSDALNHIYKWDFEEGRKIELACIDKPAYYATMVKNGTMVIGVHHEPMIQRNVEETADIWVSEAGRSWRRAVKIPFKPSRRSYGTKYASICLPLGDHSVDEIYFTPLNIEENDFSLMAAVPNQSL